MAGDADKFAALFDLWTVNQTHDTGQPLPLGQVDHIPDEILGALVAEGLLNVTLSERAFRTIQMMISNVEDTERLLKHASGYRSEVDQMIDTAFGLT